MIDQQLNESGEQRIVEQLWLALKRKCCADPENAVRIVMLSKEAFVEAVGPHLHTPSTTTAIGIVTAYRDEWQKATTRFEQAGKLTHATDILCCGTRAQAANEILTQLQELGSEREHDAEQAWKAQGYFPNEADFAIFAAGFSAGKDAPTTHAQVLEDAAGIINRFYGCSDHDQPTHCVECDVRHKALAAVRSLGVEGGLQSEKLTLELIEEVRDNWFDEYEHYASAGIPTGGAYIRRDEAVDELLIVLRERLSRNAPQGVVTDGE